MKIGGQLIFRNTELTKGKTNLVMVVGVLGCTGEFPLKGEHQYMVFGNYSDRVNMLNLNVLDMAPVDLTEKIRGLDLGQTLTMPLWRVPESLD